MRFQGHADLFDFAIFKTLTQSRGTNNFIVMKNPRHADNESQFESFYQEKKTKTKRTCGEEAVEFKKGEVHVYETDHTEYTYFLPPPILQTKFKKKATASTRKQVAPDCFRLACV